MDITGTLTITAAESPEDQRFTINVASLDGALGGNAAGSFDVGDVFMIARTTGGVNGFDPDKFVINTAGLTNGFPAFTISSDGMNIYLGAVPEPSSLLLVALGLLSLGVVGRQRRART